jgi:hypothetical protein
MTRADWNRLTKDANVSQRTIERWESSVRLGVSLERSAVSGRPTLMTPPVIAALLEIAQGCQWLGTNEFYSVALRAKGFKVSTSAVHRYITRAGWKSGTASTVPLLSAEDCRARDEFCRQMRQLHGSRIVFLHGDEKCFTAEGMARQRAPPDVQLHRPSSSGQYKNTIMVWSVVGVPQPEYDFDGRLQLSLIGRLHVASVASKNHEKGDVFVKNDQTVDGAFFFNLVTTETAPKIREQFADAELVYLQIDNAPGHTGKDNSTEIERAVNEDGQKPFIKIVFQPANSPDLNLNDLGVFHSMQKMYRVVRTRAKLKAAARQIESAPFVDGVGTRGQRAAAAAGARGRAPAMRRDATPSPTPKAAMPMGCANHHNNESDADMPCIKCRKAGNLPADCGNGKWVRCDANGGWWHEACVLNWHQKVKLPAKDYSKWVCAICTVGPSAEVGRVDSEYEDDDEPDDEAWNSVFDVDVPIRYGTDDHEALWGAVRASWSALRPQMLEKLWGTLQKIYKLVVESKGGNRYEIRSALNRVHDEDDESE